MKLVVCTFLLLLTVPYAKAQAWKTYPFEPVNSLISFPLDEGRHDSEPIEWWYSVGHFTGKDTGTPYSYMLCYFYTQQFIYDGFRIFSLCNDKTGEFYTESLPLQYTDLSTNRMNLNAMVGLLDTRSETWKNVTDNEEIPIAFVYEQKAEAEGFAINFKHESEKSPLIVADSGYLYIGEGAYSYYYSQTRNLLSGSLTLDGVTEEIEGTSWFDRQYGNFVIAQDNSYEWFSIQLSNGTELLVYNVFTSDGRIPDLKQNRILALTDSANNQFTSSDFNIERLAYKYTQDIERCYAQKWRIVSDTYKIDLTCSALHTSTEVQTPIRFYEGAMNISGTINGATVSGKGFAELIHHYEVPEVLFSNPVLSGNDSLLLAWEILNKDEGNPLKYTLSYALNLEEKLNIIVQNFSDTSLNWELPELQNNDLLTFYIRAQSVDGTLFAEETAEYSHISSRTNNVINRSLIKIFPNPANSTLFFESDEEYILDLYTINGKKVITSGNIKAKVFKQNIADLPPGLYIAKMNFDGNSISRKIRIKH